MRIENRTELLGRGKVSRTVVQRGVVVWEEAGRYHSAGKLGHFRCPCVLRSLVGTVGNDGC